MELRKWARKSDHGGKEYAAMPERVNLRSVVTRNLRWFQRSGVMRPADGFWGVAERLVCTKDNPAAEKALRAFPCFTPLAEGVVAMEHRRADCNFQTAYLFDWAAEVFDRPDFRAIADNILQFLLGRSHLRQSDTRNPAFGLWGWAMPIRMTSYWVDDNAWVITLLLLLAERGRPELRPLGVDAARTLCRHVREYLRRLFERGSGLREEDLADLPMAGLLLNPHWLGLACMAMAQAALVDSEMPYGEVIESYWPLVLNGPTPREASFAVPSEKGPRWSISEYAYLALAAVVVARHFPRGRASEVVEIAGRELLRHQAADGHLPAEHAEAPTAPHLADLIYTDNWAALAFRHLSLLTGDPAYRAAADRSLAFLARIQDRSSSPLFNGCWRGMYDTRAGAWGGGDRYEGGANSIYTGWTNAPIAWAFLMGMDVPCSLFGSGE